MSQDEYSRPFAAVVQEMRKGELAEELTDELAKLVAEVVKLGKPGSLTLKLTVRLAAKRTDMVVLEDDLTTKPPRPEVDPTLFYATDAGHLSRGNRREPELPLRQVTAFAEELSMAATDIELNALGTRTENDAVIELARIAGAQVRDVPGAEHLQDVVLPPGHVHHMVDLERYQDRPRRTTGQVLLHTAQAFAVYMNRHKDVDTMLYADVSTSGLVAVLNDSTGDAPGWGDHRANLTLRKTDPWTLWAGLDGKMVDQVAFAEHIERGEQEIVAPPAADMLELAQKFEATQKLTFRSATRLRDGQRQLIWDESTETTLPAELRLSIQPYEGSATFQVAARLRTRMSDGHLQVGYVLVRPAEILREAFLSALGTIEDMTHLEALLGTPPVRS